MFELKQRLYLLVSDAAAAIRKELALCSLDARGRRAYQGKWFHTAREFADRAAWARDCHDELLADVPFSGEDLRARLRRVGSLEDAQIILRALLKDVDDTLLIERAAIFDMAIGVLRSLELLQRHPYRSHGILIRLAGTVAHLRFAFDRRNKKISKTKRQQAKNSPSEAIAGPAAIGPKAAKDPARTLAIGPAIAPATAGSVAKAHELLPSDCPRTPHNSAAPAEIEPPTGKPHL